MPHPPSPCSLCRRPAEGLSSDCAGCIWSDAPPTPREVEEHPRVELLRGLLEDARPLPAWFLVGACLTATVGRALLDLGGVL